MSSLLNKVHSNTDLKKLTALERISLAKEIRETILNVVQANGGHLGSNLGIVELTIALHTVFDSPKDKIIWDVGHQSYVHKILTGRQDSFKSIRLDGGISGYIKRGDSPHDIFGAGHSSTSISAASGILLSQRLQGIEGKCIAVIGDAAIASGMSFEAMNHAYDTQLPLIVILNDNDMSISPSVGGLKYHLNKIVAYPAYHSAKDFVKRNANKFIANQIKTVNSVTRMNEFSSFFNSIGMEYIGIIDGHDTEETINILSKVKSLDINRPILLHVRTQKGKGHNPSELSPDNHHGIKKISIPTSVVKSTRKTYTAVFGEAICNIAKEDKRVVAITAAMRDGTGLSEFSKHYKDRFFDVGIAEQHAVTLAAGMTCSGSIPLVCIYSTFIQRAYDQIVHDVIIQNLPVKFILDRSGLVGEDGVTHFGLLDETMFMPLDNMVIVAPSSELSIINLMKFIIPLSSPCVLRYSKSEALSIPGEQCEIVMGKGRFIDKTTGDVAIISVGSMLEESLKAKEELINQHNIHVGLFDCLFIKPFDTEALDYMLQNYKHIVICNESLSYGLINYIKAYAMDRNSPCKIHSINIDTIFIDGSNLGTQKRNAKITYKDISNKILNLFN